MTIINQIFENFNVNCGRENKIADLKLVLCFFQRLKAAVELIVGDLSGEVSEQLGVEFCRETIATLALITVGKIERSAADLESFANHAKRTTVTTEDVKLLTRRNTHLVGHF